MRADKYHGLVGNDSHIKEANERLRQLAMRDGDYHVVLLLGETGTGKSLAAECLHHCAHPSDGAPFVQVNCAGKHSDLIDSDLFGHKKGSFTGAVNDKPGKFHAAKHGTLFLDEIGDLSFDLQGKLLHAVEQGEVEPVGASKSEYVPIKHLIFATNKDLYDSKNQGEFREDLYYRISQRPIYLPPLRERREDIFYLIEVFTGNRQLRFTTEARDFILNHSWPGNVRQLNNVVKSCLDEDLGRKITLKDLKTIQPDLFREQTKDSQTSIPPGIQALLEMDPEAISVKDCQEQAKLEVTKLYWSKLIQKHGRNTKILAEKTGYRVRTVQDYLKQYGL